MFFQLFKMASKFGVYIIPAHYYSPIPNINELAGQKDIWAQKSELPGIKAGLDEQVANLKKVCISYQKEYIGNKTYLTAVADMAGPGFGYIEAQALHAVIRHFKPRQIIEVGSGISTYCLLNACELNQMETGKKAQITCIEPYPFEGLKNNPNLRLLSQKVQVTPHELFSSLQENDFLFIDSSHTVKPGSDVNYLVLEILPRLNNGVIFHFHDINFPYDYQRDVLQTFWHWTETSLLRAFLIFNYRAEIIFSLSMLHYDRPATLKEVFPEYDPQRDVQGLVNGIYRPFEARAQHFPSSIYIKIRS
jgi:hypothetical protein